MDFSGSAQQQQQQQQLSNGVSSNQAHAESKHHYSDSQSSQGNLVAAANEAVMDPDIRQANRLNLELMVLQNAAQNMMGNHRGPGMLIGGGGGQTQAPPGVGRSLRSKSLTGSGAGCTGSGFPQSGILPAASEFSQQAILSRQQQQLYNGSNEILYQQQQQDNCPVPGGSPMNSRKIRTTSGDQDSGYAGLIDSRKSSLNNPFGQFPSVKIIVRPIIQAKQSSSLENNNDDNENSSIQIKKTFLNTLASIGRSMSKSSADYNLNGDSENGDRKQREQLLEVQLVEAHNIGIGGAHRGSNGCLGANNNNQLADNNNTGFANRTKSRRESLLGALVAATTSGGSGANSPQSSQRRSSIDGIYVRIFKHQCEQSTTNQQQIKRSDSSEQPNQHDSLSIHSSMSIMSAGGPANNSNDFIQTPLVKVNNNQSGCEAGNTINFLELAQELRDAYKFVCRESEFPLRISLYQVGKRGGARYTIGHCFVSISDWSLLSSSSDHSFNGAANSPPPPLRQQSKRFSNGSNQSGYQSEEGTMAGGINNNYYYHGNNDEKYLILNNTSNSNDHSQAADIQLEYRLYQTILEAIK